MCVLCVQKWACFAGIKFQETERVGVHFFLEGVGVSFFCGGDGGILHFLRFLYGKLSRKENNQSKQAKKKR